MAWSLVLGTGTPESEVTIFLLSVSTLNNFQGPFGLQDGQQGKVSLLADKLTEPGGSSSSERSGEMMRVETNTDASRMCDNNIEDGFRRWPFSTGKCKGASPPLHSTQMNPKGMNELAFTEHLVCVC